MCGILVHIGREKLDPGHSALEIIRHRGPDAYGMVDFETACGQLSLGHRRLSIIDLDPRSNQPFSYDNGNLWIVFNGEIYNYLELKKELISQGCEFRTQSDTEVILAAYCKWGKQCLKKFNGMFSFCIFDRREGRMFFARDRFGIKPLYIWNRSGSFCAASEIKQFTCIPGFSAVADPAKLYHFLNSGDFDFDDETMWKGVREIEPGCLAEIELNKWSPGRPFTIEKWYELNYRKKSGLKFDDAVEKFQGLLKDSIKLRLRADVPVGFLLSGGLDSSSLVGLCTQIPRSSEASLKTFSSCYENSPVDERKYINKVLEHTGASSSLHFPKPEDVANNLDRVIWHNDIPVRHGSPVPHWLLYQHIQEDNDFRKVIIEGQGGDEILCGYRDFFWSMIYTLIRTKKYPQSLLQLLALRSKHSYSPKIILRKLGRLAFPSLVKYPPDPAINVEALLGSAKAPGIPIRREQPSVQDMHKARLQILRYILHNVDRNSMAHSRETRVPFLDYRLVEFCISLPDKHKIYNGTTKRILRASVENVIPEMIINRGDKQGYSSPIPTWLGKEILPFFRESIDDAANLPFVNRSLVLKQVGDFIDGKRPFDPIWWNIMATNRWLKIFKISV
ncbi:MAG: asparagine synthase (glutamine-hydrolyzing) [Victivallales bacterium]